MRRRHRLLPSLSIGGLLLLCSILLSHSPAEGTTLSAKRIILDTDLYSDVDDAGALLLLLTEPPHVETLAVCLSHPSRYSALAAAGMIDYYASSSARKPIPLGLPLQRHSLRSECCGRLTNESFFDQYYFRFGEYASKVAYGWARRSPTTAEISPPSPVASSDDAGSSLGWDDVAPEGTVRDGGMHWGNAVDVYRRVLAHVLREAEESGRLDESSWKVTVVVIGFLDNIAFLLDSPPDLYSPLNGTALFHATVSRLVVMGGWYPASRPSRPSFNFFGSGAPQRAARVVNTWPTRRSDGIANESGIGTSAELVFLGDEVGEAVKTGAKLMRDGPPGDPVRAAYEAYLGGCSCSRDGSGGGRGGRESWDPLTVLYVLTADDSEDEGARLFEQGAAYGYNVVDARDGSNAWVWDEDVTNQSFLRLRVDNETAAAAIDRRMLDGAWRAHEVAAATIARAAQRSRENSTGGYMDEL